MLDTLNVDQGILAARTHAGMLPSIDALGF